MEITAVDEIAARPEAVFAALTGDGFVRLAAENGAVAVPRDGDGPGAVWDLSFAYRGLARTVPIRTIAHRAPDHLAMTGESDGLRVDVSVRLEAPAPNRTRLSLTADLVPRTIGARLLTQSLRLARGTLDRKAAAALAVFARAVERDAAGRAVD